MTISTENAPTKPKIFVFINQRYSNGDEVPFAMAEDGAGLASHFCSAGWARHDMGFGGSTWKHEHYNAHYPNGWELEWVDDFDSHEGLKAAIARADEAATPEPETPEPVAPLGESPSTEKE
jgi:hypothetical protein